MKVAGYLSDINLINIDKTLPDAHETLENGNLRDKELDEWWDLVFQTEKYPHLTLVAAIAITIRTIHNYRNDVAKRKKIYGINHAFNYSSPHSLN